MFFGAHSIIFETLFVFAGKITFRFSPRALFDLPDLRGRLGNLFKRIAQFARHFSQHGRGKLNILIVFR